MNPRGRLRAQVSRLNAAGGRRRQIAKHAHRTYGAVCQDRKRWRDHGLDGLADAAATNPPEKITQPLRAFVREKPQEGRTWTCSQLIEAVLATFGSTVAREALRLGILRPGSGWHRARYGPGAEVDPDVVREHQARATLQRGPPSSA